MKVYRTASFIIILLPVQHVMEARNLSRATVVSFSLARSRCRTTSHGFSTLCLRSEGRKLPANGNSHYVLLK